MDGFAPQCFELYILLCFYYQKNSDFSFCAITNKEVLEKNKERFGVHTHSSGEVSKEILF